MLLCYVGLVLILSSLSYCTNESQNVTWDYLMFAQVWSGSVCRVANKLHNDTCLIPAGINTWTVHGLWPSVVNSSKGPSFCPGQQKHFNVSNLDTIVDKLEKRWPNLIPKKSHSSLWKHEWEKHGSCAITLESLSNELHYFKAGLLFNDEYDILKALDTANIVPSDTTTYSLSDFESALKQLITKTFEVYCLRCKVEDKWYFSDVRVCIDKALNLIDCEKKESSQQVFRSEYYNLGAMPTPTLCPHDKPLTYPLLSELITVDKEEL